MTVYWYLVRVMQFVSMVSCAMAAPHCTAVPAATS